MAASNVQSHLPSVHTHSSDKNSTSPPNRRDLVSWWSGFKKKTKKEEEKAQPPAGIFGVALDESVKYANVAISLTNDQGESYTYGYVPIVIAKCGVFLKEKGTDIHGIFRLPGSAKRIKELQTTFDSPDRYGKGLDWSGYTVHDAGSIFRRYINTLPEPVIPLDFYEKYREPIRHHQKTATGDPDAPEDPTSAEKFDHAEVIKRYQKLITELPALNRQLLLYLLDLLAVFSSKSEINGMDSFNLSAVFQPGILSHPKHDLVPHEYKLSQNVLVYLILNQDHFLVGMSGTEADEKTVQDVQGGAQRQPTTPNKSTHAGLGRSASNASAGADSLRKAGIRRNASVSSKQSNLSSNPPAGSPAPGSPLANASSSGGVHRSNTVPSKKSPGLGSPRFSKAFAGEVTTPRSSSHSPAPKTDSENQKALPAVELNEKTPERPAHQGVMPMPTTPEHPPTNDAEEAAQETPTQKTAPEIPSNEKLRLRSPEPGVTTTVTSDTPTKDRKSFFSKSPTGDSDRRDSRQPNKLKKKSRPSDAAPYTSAQSSAHSLPGVSDTAEQRNRSPRNASRAGMTENSDHGVSTIPTLLETEASPAGENPPRLGELDKVSSFHVSRSGSREPSPVTRPSKSPVPSLHSGQVTEESDGDQAGNGSAERSSRRRSRWRLSSSHKKDFEPSKDAGTQSRLGSTAVVEEEPALTGSPPQRPRKTATEDSQQTTTATESSAEKDHEGDERERKGLFGRIKAKVHHSKEERKEKEAEKERVKSPSRSANEKAISKQSLGAVTSEMPSGVQGVEVHNEEQPKQEEEQR